MNYNELKKLIFFPAGIPSIYRIKLGMSVDEAECYQKELDAKKTDNYDINDMLNKYDVTVEEGFLEYHEYDDIMIVNNIDVFIPATELSEYDVRKLHEYIGYEMEAIEKKFSITTDADDSIKELDATLHAELYDVSIRLNEDHDYIIISFCANDNEDTIDMLRCISIISYYETCLHKEFFDKLTEHIINQRQYYHYD